MTAHLRQHRPRRPSWPASRTVADHGVITYASPPLQLPGALGARALARTDTRHDSGRWTTGRVEVVTDGDWLTGGLGEAGALALADHARELAAALDGLVGVARRPPGTGFAVSTGPC